MMHLTQLEVLYGKKTRNKYLAHGQNHSIFGILLAYIAKQDISQVMMYGLELFILNLRINIT